MLRDGARILIGDEYARRCSYLSAVGKLAELSGDPYLETSPYQLTGKHYMCFVTLDDNSTWEIHLDDAIPFGENNKGASILLDKEY
jgi:hypothetical protein